MADAAVKKPSTKVIDSWKAKRWYKIVSSQMFGAQQIGETVAVEDSQLIGRTVNVSLGLVVGDAKRQNTNVIFEVNKVENGTAFTDIKKLEIAPSSIRRMIRKGKDRLDLSMVCATKDNVILRIKPFLVTRGKIGGSVMTNLRNTLDAVLRVEANKTTYEGLIRDIVQGKLQRTIKQRLNKTYPLKVVEIRAIEKTTIERPLPPIPVLPEIVEEKVQETEEEKVVKKAKAVEEPIDEAVLQEKIEKKPKNKKN